MFTPTPQQLDSDTGRRVPLAGKLAIGAAAMLVAGGVAVGVSAATGEDAPEPAPYEPNQGEVIEIDDSDGWAGLEIPDPTAEDLLIRAQFDDCLTENGVAPSTEPLAEFDDGAEAPEPEPIEIDPDVLDICLPILENESTWDFFGTADAPMPELVEIRDDG